MCVCVCVCVCVVCVSYVMTLLFKTHAHDYLFEKISK